MDSFNETVIEHYGGEEYSGVSTGERTVKNRLAKLAEQYPDDVKCIANNKDGSVFYHIPWKWVSIRPPRRVILTDEQRAERSERAKLNFGKI